MKQLKIGTLSFANFVVAFLALACLQAGGPWSLLALLVSLVSFIGFGQLYKRVLNRPNYAVLRKVFGTDWFKYKRLLESTSPSIFRRSLPVAIMCLCASSLILYSVGYVVPFKNSGSIWDTTFVIVILSYFGMFYSASLALANAVGKEKNWIYALILAYMLLVYPFGDSSGTATLAWRLVMAPERHKLEQIVERLSVEPSLKLPIQVGFHSIETVTIIPIKTPPLDNYALYLKQIAFRHDRTIIHINKIPFGHGTFLQNDPYKIPPALGKRIRDKCILVLEERCSGMRLIHIPPSKQLERQYGGVAYLGNGWWISSFLGGDSFLVTI